MPCVCSVVDNRWRQNVVETKKMAHEAQPSVSLMFYKSKYKSSYLSMDTKETQLELKLDTKKICRRSLSTWDLTHVVSFMIKIRSLFLVILFLEKYFLKILFWKYFSKNTIPKKTLVKKYYFLEIAFSPACGVVCFLKLWIKCFEYCLSL